MTTADAIRAHALKHPALAPSERARVLSAALGIPVSRQQVHAALRRSGQRGRPRKPRCEACGGIVP